MGSSDPVVREFTMRLIAKADDPRLSQFGVLKAYKDINALKATNFPNMLGLRRIQITRPTT